jgi:hypothetical protein
VVFVTIRDVDMFVGLPQSESHHINLTLRRLVQKQVSILACYLITPSVPIKSGEYILFTIVPDTQGLIKANTPQALGGYDFGVHAK